VPAVGVARLVDCDDVVVLEPGQGLGLAVEEAPVELVHQVVATQDLERNPPLRPLLLGLPHDAHATLAEHAENAVAGNALGFRADVFRSGLPPRRRGGVRLGSGAQVRGRDGQLFVIGRRTRTNTPVGFMRHCEPPLSSSRNRRTGKRRSGPGYSAASEGRGWLVVCNFPRWNCACANRATEVRMGPGLSTPRRLLGRTEHGSHGAHMGYDTAVLVGSGGMGEVFRAWDPELGALGGSEVPALGRPGAGGTPVP